MGVFENARIPAGDNGTEGVIKTYAYLCFHVCRKIFERNITCQVERYLHNIPK